MKRKIWLISAVVLVLVATGAFYATPYFTLYSMHKAVERQDAALLAQYVDFPALRDDLKAQLTDSITRSGKANDHGGDIAKRGTEVALGAMHQIIDSMVSPEGVEKMLESQKNVRQFAVSTEPGAGPVGTTDATDATKVADAPLSLGYEDIHVRYLDWSHVRVTRVDGAGGGLLMRRKSLLGWMLVGIELP